MRLRLLAAALAVAFVLAPAATAAIQVSITSPTDGSHSLSGVVPVQITASADQGIYSVQLDVDGKPYGNPDTTAVNGYQYEIDWDTSGFSVGTHTLTANAVDWSKPGGGSQQLSAPVTVDVGPAYPTIALSAPPSWSFARGSVQLSANVTSVGSSTVQFAVDGSPVATLNAAPWTTSWNSASVADGSHQVTATVTDGRGKQASAGATVTVDNTPPLASIVSPAPGSYASGTLPVSASASDAYGIASVRFAIDGTPAGPTLTQPDSSYTYSATLDISALAAGTTHQLTAIATDGAGNITTAGPVSFTIGAPLPAVTITSPPDWTFARGTVPVAASVTGGSLPDKVVLVVDGQATTQQTSTAPYTLQWDTTKLADGSHTIALQVVDSLGRSALSQTIHQTVDNTKPAALMYQPAAGARVNGPTTFQVHASDAYGVKSVQFTVDAKPVGSLLTVPDAGQQYLYSISFDTSTLTPGTHAVSAVVTDNAGNTTSPAAVSIKTGPIQYLPVLNYHEIAPPDGYSIYDQTPAEADQQLAYLKANGYQSVTLAQYQQWLAGQDIGIAKPVLITVDDGLKSELAWDPLLQKYGFKAVLFEIVGFADQTTPGDADPNNMTWADVQSLAANGRWEIAFHAGQYGHGDSYGAGGATIRLNATQTLSLLTMCPYFYTCLGTVTTTTGIGRTKRTTTAPESFATYQSLVMNEVTQGMAELKQKVPNASFVAWAGPFNDEGQWTNLYNDATGQVQSWFPGYMASKFPAVMMQTNPVTYGQASGTVGSLTGFNRHYRFEVHTDTTIQQYAQALSDPAFAR